MQTLIESLKVAFQQVRHAEEAFSTFLKSLFFVRMQYRTDNKKLPQNVLLFLFHSVEMLVDSLLRIKEVGHLHWIHAEARARITSHLTAVVDDETIDVKRTMKFLLKVEEAMAPNIDILAIVCHFCSFEGLLFDIFLQGDIVSTSYLDVLCSFRQNCWKIFKKLIFGEKNIQVSCFESHLNTPSECAVLAQFLFQLRERFCLEFQDVQCFIARRAMRSEARRSGSEPKFSSTTEKGNFLKEVVSSALNIPVTTVIQNTMEKPHRIILSNRHFLVKILTQDGIAYWWNARNEGKIPEPFVLKQNPLTELTLRNLASRYHPLHGICFIINYVPCMTGEHNIQNELHI